MLKRRKVIIDTDCGTDDAVAIMLALVEPTIEILAFTCVAGNCTVSDVTRNIGSLLDHFHMQHIPYYAGASKPLLHHSTNTHTPINQWDGHGSDGFGNVSLAPDFVHPSTSAHPHEHAANALVRLVNENAGEVHIITIGPLTNIALATSLDPSFSKKAAGVTAMMGSYAGQGNIGFSAEYNVAFDPEASAIVLENEWREFNMITWCLTNECALPWSWYKEHVANSLSYTGKLIKMITLPYAQLCQTDIPLSNPLGEIDMRDPNHFNMNDALAMITFLYPDCVKQTIQTYCVVELNGAFSRGVTLFDHFNKFKKPPNCNLVVKVDKKVYVDAFEKLLMWTVPQ